MHLTCKCANIPWRGTAETPAAAAAAASIPTQSTSFCKLFLPLPLLFPFLGKFCSSIFLNCTGKQLHTEIQNSQILLESLLKIISRMQIEDFFDLLLK